MERRGVFAAGVWRYCAQLSVRIPAKHQVIDSQMLTDFEIEIGEGLRSGCRPDSYDSQLLVPVFKIRLRAAVTGR
ncbi:hypothetical protein [Mesorhizobium tianshanense]|uniref:hypothetical protein n=1 Tax=Mesorhizobium tianshanense TaxID=39844 RepID=UPI0011A55265|nr:hypothetical protein [Mesorhizobium tianshanense]